MRARELGRPTRRAWRRGRAAAGAVLSPAAGMRPGAVVGCSISLLVAGVLLARGFIGVLPGRPVYLLLGGLLAGTALLSLVIDHVAVRVRPEHPDHLLVAELDRSRRYQHPLALVTVRSDEVTALQVVSRLRSTDRAWRAGSTLVVLLSETDRRQAELFAARVDDVVDAPDIHVAAFPEDAVTADGLFAVLRGADDPSHSPEAAAPSAADAAASSEPPPLALGG